jgi:hypothetical protein
MNRLRQVTEILNDYNFDYKIKFKHDNKMWIYCTYKESEVLLEITNDSTTRIWIKDTWVETKMKCLRNYVSFEYFIQNLK